MVNKMNLKLQTLILFLLAICTNLQAADIGLSAIKHRQYVACGTDSEYRLLAYKENDIWKGFDADICRAIAAATLGDAERFKIIPTPKELIGKKLNYGEIDIMLGHNSLSAIDETKLYVTPIDILYYDRQIFAARNNSINANSMKDFSKTKVCVLRNSTSSIFVHEYNQKHALGFKILEMPTLTSAKEGFYLSRCELITGNEFFIRNIVHDLKSANQAQILPEEIAYIPIKAYSAGNNPSLNIALRWIINALKLAYASDISSQNIDTHMATKSQSIKNLLGLSPEIWKSLKLESNWAKDYIKTYGNYQQILERNIGELSPLKINIQQNDLTEKGGLLSSIPFI